MEKWRDSWTIIGKWENHGKIIGKYGKLRKHGTFPVINGGLRLAGKTSN